MMASPEEIVRLAAKLAELNVKTLNEISCLVKRVAWLETWVQEHEELPHPEKPMSQEEIEVEAKTE